MKLLHSLIVLLALSPCLSKAATVTVSVAFLNDASGTPISTDFMWFVSADVGNDGFDAPTGTDFIGGSDDDVILIGPTLQAGVNGQIQSANNPITDDGGLVGTPLRLVWFPTLTTSSASPGGEIAYGTYGEGVGVEVNGTMGFEYPGLGSHTLGALRDTLTGAASNADFTASSTIVPEPSGALLCLFGLSLLTFIRRRK